MSLCPACGLETSDNAALCRHHFSQRDNWAESNRIMCDFFHRRKVLPRLTREVRGGEFWAHADAA